MKRAIKATLLSAFILPGAGHIFLKKYRLGIVFGSVSLAAIGYSLVKSVEISLSILGEIQSGAVPLDVAAITGLLAKQTTPSQLLFLNIATFVVAICWLAGIVDSYRLGRGMDKDDDLLVDK